MDTVSMHSGFTMPGVVTGQTFEHRRDPRGA